MSTSTYSYTADQTLPIPDASEMRFGIIVTEWNQSITDKLLAGTIEELEKNGVPTQNITVKRVPGSFELIYAAAQLAKFGHVNGIIILGWGVVQLGMSVQSHDATQRTQGVLCLFGGLLIAFAKEILTAIGVV